MSPSVSQHFSKGCLCTEIGLPLSCQTVASIIIIQPHIILPSLTFPKGSVGKPSRFLACSQGGNKSWLPRYFREVQTAVGLPPVDFTLSPCASKAIRLGLRRVKLCLTLLPAPSLCAIQLWSSQSGGGRRRGERNVIALLGRLPFLCFSLLRK